MRKRLITSFMIFVLPLFLAGSSYGQDTAGQSQDTSLDNAKVEPVPDKKLQEAKEADVKKLEVEKKEDAEKKEAEEAKKKKELESSDVMTEEVPEEEDEWGGNVWDRKSVEKRDSWHSDQDRRQSGLGTEDMWKF